uniref:Uncharacterized protein n=1 Tax=uncultured Desulfobacterium sp. TaxID=201089 RepID=E1Y8P5_9BACT|nr:unknown protein [uncultured Desulfobacterium sp.]
MKVPESKVDLSGSAKRESINVNKKGRIISDPAFNHYNL